MAVVEILVRKVFEYCTCESKEQRTMINNMSQEKYCKISQLRYLTNSTSNMWSSVIQQRSMCHNPNPKPL